MILTSTEPIFFIKILPDRNIKKTKPRIHQFTNLKCCKKNSEPFKTFLNDLLFITLKKHFKHCSFILKALKDILQHFKFVNWWIRGFVSWCYEQVICIYPSVICSDKNGFRIRSHLVYFYCWFIFCLFCSTMVFDPVGPLSFIWDSWHCLESKFKKFRYVLINIIYRISSYNCRGNYSFLNSSSEETIQVFISLM